MAYTGILFDLFTCLFSHSKQCITLLYVHVSYNQTIQYATARLFKSGHICPHNYSDNYYTVLLQYGLMAYAVIHFSLSIKNKHKSSVYLSVQLLSVLILWLKFLKQSIVTV